MRSSVSPKVLERAAARVRQPRDPLLGRRATTLALPDNVICFQHASAARLNQPQHGRALHHRFVLMAALRTAATVCVDDRAVRLGAGEGLLIHPFQFHHYINAGARSLRWLFVTFELTEAASLESLRYQPFTLTLELRGWLLELIRAYQAPDQDDRVVLMLGLILARLRRLDPAHHRPMPAPGSPELATQINLLAQRPGETPRVRELAGTLGISTSHLRARFRASCGVSLGRHLRRLRLEKACGLLRISRDRVSEIAEQCGFNSVYAFSRAFRAAFGQSPLAYRRGGVSTL